MMEEFLGACTGCSSTMLQPLSATDKISVCARCGLIFDNPRPSAEAIRIFYSREEKYDGWLAELAEREGLWGRRLAKILKCEPGRGALLDVGTGIGQFLKHADPLFLKVDGTEVSSSAVGIARERYGLDIIKGHLEEVSLPGKYDLITAFHVLEHVPFPGTFLDKCFELLGEGGMLVLAVPNDVRSLGARVRRLFRKLGLGRFARYSALGLPILTLQGETQEVHLSHFTAESLARLLSARGFVVGPASLDPYFVASGARLARHETSYRLQGWIHALTGINLYHTIWITAVKPAAR